MAERKLKSALNAISSGVDIGSWVLVLASWLACFLVGATMVASSGVYFGIHVNIVNSNPWLAVWLRNLLVAGALFLVGTALGRYGIAGVMAVQGLIQGLTAGVLIQDVGVLPIFAALASHGVIEVPALAYLGSMGVKRRMLKGMSRGVSIKGVVKVIIKNAYKPFVAVACLLFIAALIETTLSVALYRTVS